MTPHEIELWKMGVYLFAVVGGTAAVVATVVLVLSLSRLGQMFDELRPPPPLPEWREKRKTSTTTTRR